jgi:pimeloyl-ACP methyl ester carboxylesterase
MAADPDEQPLIRRGKGLRLSTGAPPPAEPTPSPAAPPAPAAGPEPISRRRGLRLSTQVAAPDLAGAEPAAPFERGPELEAVRWRIATSTGAISYMKSGQGRPLLLVHGYGATARIWAGARQSLGDLRTSYALDLPGFGASPPRSEAPTLPALADALVAFADALGLERFDLLGHALGAAVAAVVAGRHPARVGRLVAISLGARTFAPELAAVGRSRPPFDLTFGAARPLIDLWQPLSRMLMQSPPMALTLGALMLHRQPPSEAELWREFLADHAAADPRASITSLTAVGDQALLEALRAIVAPTLCIAGSEDRVARSVETRAAQELIGGSRLLMLDACGHMPMLEQPAAFHLAVRQFLAA